VESFIFGNLNEVDLILGTHSSNLYKKNEAQTDASCGVLLWQRGEF
jgi:hypothetical protein